MKVLAVIEALPGVGKVKARRTMEEIGIADTRRVRGLGEQQRKALLEAFASPLVDRRHLRPWRGRQGHARRPLPRRNPQFWLSRSWTTRARRPGEPEDAYVFVSPEEFQARIDADGFLEWAPFLDYRQGTPRLADGPADDVLLEIDMQGARQIRELHPDALLIFVDAPSRDEQRRRLEERGDGPERIAAAPRPGRRRGRAGAEALGMHRVVNDDLEQAVLDIEALVRASREA